MKKEMQNTIIDTGRVHYPKYGRNNGKLHYEDYYFGEDFEYEIVVPVKHTRKEDNFLGDWEFSDRLAPLDRWINKQHGRKWDDVFSEICKKADYRNVRGRHLIEHVLDYVWVQNSNRSWRNHWFITGLYKGQVHVDENGILIVPWHDQARYSAHKKRNR